MAVAQHSDRIVSGTRRRWLTPGVGGIGTASFLADVGHEVPTALLPSFVTTTLGAPAAALGLIEGISEGLAGTGRFIGGALADDPARRRAVAVGGYTSSGEHEVDDHSRCVICREDRWPWRRRRACTVHAAFAFHMPRLYVRRAR